MIDITYNLSSEIKSSLNTIDFFRNKILLLTISPKVELRTRWEAMVNRIYWTTRMWGKDTRKETVVKILRNIPKKNLNQVENHIFTYRFTFENLLSEWTAVKNQVPLSLDEKIRASFDIPSLPASSQSDLKKLLSYVFAGTDHPIISASISQFWYDAVGSGRGSSDAFVGRFMSYVYLFKGGYGVRGMVLLEEELNQEPDVYIESFSLSLKRNNLTKWIEYYVQCAALSFEKTYEKLEKHEFSLSVEHKHFELTERDILILAILDDPESGVTNKMVQKYARVSQITASRILSRLVGLGLLLPHGKGRSVYYTKV